MGRRGVGCLGEEERAGKEDPERGTQKQADRQTHTQTGKGHIAIRAARYSDKLAVKCSISHPN